MNLALFGDPYYVRMILHNIHYVYKNCTTVYVPDFLNTDNNSCDIVSIEKTINNLDAIDEVLTLYRENPLPSPIKNFLNRKLKNISTKNININNMHNSFQHKNYNSKLLKLRPTILSLSMGQASQQYHVELLINRCLRKMNLNFYQCYSPESRYILTSQNFNNSCSNIYEDYRSDYDLFVGGLTVSNINELLDEQSSACSLIRRMLPDAVVISCNATPSYIHNNIYQAIEIFNHRYNIQRVIVVVSEYYFNESLNVSIKISPPNIATDRNFFYISNFNKTTEAEFINQLLSGVYLPDGVVPV